MRKHIRYIAVAVAAASLAGLTACSPAGNSDGKTAITLLMADPQKNLQPALDGFAKKYPNITVNYEYVPFDQYNNLIDQRIGSSDKGLDVYAVDSGAVGALATKGYLVDLSDMSKEVKDAVLPATYQANTFQDKLWSVPLWNSAQVLYYNKAILDKAGIPYPSADPNKPITFEELATNGKKAQEAGATWGVLFDQINRYYQLQAPIESAGGGSGATGKDLLTADLNNTGWVKAMTWYSKLFADSVAPRGIATEQMAPLFASGQAAYIVSGLTQATTNANDPTGISYGVAANPIFDGGTPAMPTGSWNLGINPASEHQDAARKLIQYLALDADGNYLAHKVTGQLPSNQAAFNKFVGELNGIDAPNTDGLGDLVGAELKNAAVNRPNSPGFTQMADVTGRAFDDIRNGQDVKGTLDSAQKELQGLWDRLK